MDNEKKISWHVLALMTFSSVWGFGNVLNGFVYFNGIQVIFSWIFLFALYFVPYALMVGELGSVFKEAGGGVGSWIQGTLGRKFAYYAGWTYWACHITYIANKSSTGLKALSWAGFQNAEVYDSLPTVYVQLATLLILVLFCYLASKGINVLKNLASLAGVSMLIMSILFVIMMFAAPSINPDAMYVKMDFSFRNLIPNFDVAYFTSLSVLVFAVGGCEKISPYVNKVDEPSRNFPKAMMALAVMVCVSAVLGTVAVGMMFDPSVINSSPAAFASYVSNGAYWACERLGQYYGIGNGFLILYALSNAIGQFATLIVSIDAPLRMLLDNDATTEFIPRTLRKKNEYGAYVNGIKLVLVLSGLLILIQSFVPGATAVLTQLTKLNSVCMPMRYLWVFIAYMALRKAAKMAKPDYQFIKNDKLAFAVGAWCFLVTSFCCVCGIYDADSFTMMLNIITPFVLVALGLILPVIAKHERKKSGNVSV